MSSTTAQMGWIWLYFSRRILGLHWTMTVSARPGQSAQQGYFDAGLNDQKLTFQWDDGKILDEQTGSEWNILGQAVNGELSGQQLTPIVHGDHFWFAWAAFRPDTIIYQGN